MRPHIVVASVTSKGHAAGNNWSQFFRDGGEPNNHSGEAAISAGGRWIAYVSQATDIAAAEGEKRPVFLYDRDSGQSAAAV